jgi:hypothetical protein
MHVMTMMCYASQQTLFDSCSPGQAKQRYLRIHPNAQLCQSVQSLRLSITLFIESKLVAYKGTNSIIRIIALAISGCDIS